MKLLYRIFLYSIVAFHWVLYVILMPFTIVVSALVLLQCSEQSILRKIERIKRDEYERNLPKEYRDKW